MYMKTIALILKEDGVLSDAQYAALEQESFATGKSLDDLLIQSDIITEAQITEARAKLYNVPYVSLATLAKYHQSDT